MEMTSPPAQGNWAAPLCAKTRVAFYLTAEKLCLCILHPPPGQLLCRSHSFGNGYREMGNSVVL